MALPALRTLSNHPSAPSFGSGSPTYVAYAEDLNLIKQTLVSASYGISTLSLQVGNATLGSYSAAIFGDTQIDGGFDVTGNVTFEADFIVNGAMAATTLTLTSTLSVSGTATLGATTISSGGLTVTSGGITVSSGNITVPALATVDGVDVGAHTHSGSGSNGVQLDGAVAIQNSTITFAKINPSSIGLSSSTLAEGSALQATRDVFTLAAEAYRFFRPIDFYGTTSTGATPYAIGAATGINLGLHSGTTGAPVAAVFANADTAGDIVWTSLFIPGYTDIDEDISISVYYSSPSGVANNYGIKLYTVVRTPGTLNDDMNVNLVSTATVTTNTVTPTAKKAEVTTFIVGATTYDLGDLLFIGIQRVAPGSGSNSASDMFLMGVKVDIPVAY